MDGKQSLRWAGYYLALSAVAAAIGFALVGVGVVLGLDAAYAQYTNGSELSAVLGTAAPGLAVAAVGVAVWLLGTLTAFYKTLTEAVDEQMGQRFDSEKVKSELLSVLDERLSEMQRDVEETRRSVSELKRDDTASEFEFGED